MAPKATANTYQNAVVLIRHSRGTAGGFLVGAQGWIVACAHVFPLREGLLQATLYSPQSNSSTTLKATMVARDFGRDLALLKVSPSFPTPFVRLETRASAIRPLPRR
jgi:S1-C subfamily serine protease